MTNEEYLDKLGTAKYLLHDQPVDENTAEFYPPESDKHPKCAELRYFAKGQLNLEFVGLITAKGLVSKYSHTYAWFEMRASGLQDIVRLWGDNNRYQIKKIIGTGTEKFMVLVEWYKVTWDSAETGKDKEVCKFTEEEIEAAKHADLIDVFGDLLVKDGLLSEEQLEKHRQERKEQMSDCKCQKKTKESNIQRMLDKEYPGEGFKCIMTTKDCPLFKQIEKLVKYADPDSEKDTRREYKLLEIGSVNDHDIAQIAGGNNGYHDWVKYFKDLGDIIHVLGQAGFDAWLIKLDNDCLDDVHYAYIGFRKLKEKDGNKYDTHSQTLSQYLLDCGCDLTPYIFPEEISKKYKKLFNSDMWSNTHVKHLELAEIAERWDSDSGLALLVGGNHEDGTTHWLSYLENIQYLLTRLREFGYQGWVCNIHNVVVGDQHEVILGYRKLEKGN